MVGGATAAALLFAGTSYIEGQIPGAARRSVTQRNLPITKFYDTSDPLPAGKPGELIRSEPFDGYTLPVSVSAVRILYHSRSAAGDDVAASGVVLFPYDKKPPAGGWPVIAWAHSATGVARACAPSLMRNIAHGPFLAMYVNLGYAVVATDYTGLGTNFRNAFVDGPSNAADIINSVPAARAAAPHLGTRWIVMGEAEGALTVVAVAEKENDVRDPDYLGGLAISDLAPAKAASDASSAGASETLISLAYGIKTVYPSFQLHDILTQKGMSLYHKIDQICSLARTPAELSPWQLLKPGWENNTFVRQYLVRSNPGMARAGGPILVISSDAGQSTSIAAAAQAVTRMCQQGDRVQWERYPDLDPGSVIGDSVRDQIGWIEARFAGRPTTTNCP